MSLQKTSPIADFSTAKLPALPQTLVCLLEECSDSNVELPEVAAIVSRDATIAAKILNLANSAFLGTRAKFLSIEQAVIYLGIDTVRNLAISVSVHESFSDISDTQHFRLSEFWYHSLLTALVARELAERTGYDNPAEAYLAGLLHDIGKCLFCTAFSEAFEQLQLSRSQDNSSLDMEKQLFGLDHAEAGCRLIENWQLVPSLARAIADHHTETNFASLDQLSRIVNVANNLAVNALTPDHSITARLGAGLNGEELKDLMHNLAEQVSLIGESLGIKVSAGIANSEKSRPAAKTTLQSETANIAQLSGMLDNLVRANTMNRILLVLEESLAILFDVKKSILLLPDGDTDRFLPAGSFRNRTLRALRDTFFFPHQEPLLQGCLASTGINRVSRSQTRPMENQLRFLFTVFEEDDLTISSFPINSEQKALLIAAPTKADDHVSHPQTIMLLLSHVGNRLQLEQLQKQHAKDQVKLHVQAIEEISRAIAHEISNPINIIQNYLMILIDKPDLPTGLGDELRIIDKEIERIAAITSQLHDLSHAQVAPSKTKTDVVSLIREVVTLFRRSLPPHADIDLHFTGDMSIQPIWSNPDFLQQVLLNLLTNSLEAIGSSGGHIEVALECPTRRGLNSSKEIVIKVCDSGPGLDPTVTEKIFQPGYTSKNGNHSGLGLAIVRKLVHDMGGTVTHLRNDRNETQFIMCLPMDFD